MPRDHAAYISVRQLGGPTYLFIIIYDLIISLSNNHRNIVNSNDMSDCGVRSQDHGQSY